MRRGKSKRRDTKQLEMAEARFKKKAFAIELSMGAEEFFCIAHSINNVKTLFAAHWGLSSAMVDATLRHQTDKTSTLDVAWLSPPTSGKSNYMDAETVCRILKLDASEQITVRNNLNHSIDMVFSPDQ